MGAVRMTCAVSRSIRAVIGLSAGSIFALTVTSSRSVSSPSCMVTPAVSPGCSTTAFATDLKPWRSATIEHVPVPASANRNSPCSFETSVLDSAFLHVSVIVTPGSTIGSPSGPAIDTVPATIAAGSCAAAAYPRRHVRRRPTRLAMRCLFKVMVLSIGKRTATITRLARCYSMR